MKPIYKFRTFTCLGCGKIVNKRTPKKAIKYCTLSCYRNSKRPQRKTGKIIICNYCGKRRYKTKQELCRKNNFCSVNCANKYQAKNKIKFICKICGGSFSWSKSRLLKHSPTYCSIICRNKDSVWKYNACIKGNLVQQNKKGLNKLELKGRKILEELGLILDKDFKEQVLMFDKFLVDIFIPSKKLIIQMDGVYWHSRKKRYYLDKSQDAYMKKCGLKVLRITDLNLKNKEIEVYANIKQAIQ